MPSGNAIGPVKFNYYVLGRGPYWWRQRQVARSVVTHQSTLVPAGNAVGKSYLAAGLLLWFLYEHPGCLVVSTAPTQTQLEEVLWKEVRRAHSTSFANLWGDVLKNPLKIDLGEGWQALGYSTTKTERLSGHHASDLLAIIDESSGVAPEIIEAIDSLNPSRLLMIGNPLRPEGPFYERCQRSIENPNGLVNTITIPSTDSPDIINGVPRSLRGLADRNWIEKARNDYGENSLWWQTHVLAEFPDSGVDSVISRQWLDLSEKAPHVRGGWPRTAIDLAEGNGGDRSVVMTGDDNGLLACEYSNTWTLEETANVAAKQVREHYVEGYRVSWDVAGIGADFANRLKAVGIVGAQPYRGGGAVPGNKFFNFRARAAWQLRQRLDPTRMVDSGKGFLVPQQTYAIRPEWMQVIRPELQALTYELGPHGEIVLIKGEELAKKLRRSPDLQATLCQLHAFGY